MKMPVSKSDQTSDKICKFCDETAHCRIWNIKIDQDILRTIKKKFPSWFSPFKSKSKNCLLTNCRADMSDAPSSSGISTFGMDHQETRISPPKAIVDSSPLQTAMDKNRESLKVKLLVRRSANQLVEQGILPPLKTSPAIHEQRKLLERAKTGDLLKAKIQQRPNRQELERRHILESHESHIDPSLADKYRMLEKAILVDQLNKKILHRPGPLELIEKNILHANEPIERIVKEGLVPFKVSSEDENPLSFEDDSQSSEGDLIQQLPQSQIIAVKDAAKSVETKSEPVLSSNDQHIFESLPTSSGVINISLVPSNNIHATLSQAPISAAKFTTIQIPPPPPPPKLELITYHVKPGFQTQVKGLINTQNFLPIHISEGPIATPILPPSLVPSQTVNQHVSSFIQNNQKFSAPGKDKNRKKSKNKAASKARAIKFHEYKGPPNKMSSSSSSSSSSSALNAIKKVGETNYELILQQQCLLEYLEGIYKNPQSIKSDGDPSKMGSKLIKIEKAESEDMVTNQESSKTFNKPHVTIFPSKPAVQILSTPVAMETSKDITMSDLAKLSKMKVSELKRYLKRVNLPVSGPKPLLIERLKPYLPLKPLEESSEEITSMMSESTDFYSTSVQSVSSAESDMENVDGFHSSAKGTCNFTTTKEEDIVAEQQRKIEELQRKLQQSQIELEQMKQNKTVDTPVPRSVAFDPKYQIHSPISTVFVVDVSQGSTNVEDIGVALSPTKIKPDMVLSVSSTTNMDESTSQNLLHDSPVLKKVINQMGTNQSVNSVSHQIESSVNPNTSANVIPMSQDISDVLEILLKSGEWPEDGKGISTSFMQNLNGFSNDLSAKNFIDDVLSAQNPFDVMSPMNEDPILPAEESLEKILDGVTPTNESSSLMNGTFMNSFNSEFPMDIGEDTPISIINPDFSSNPFQNNINRNKMKNCDSLNGQDHNGSVVKVDFVEQMQKPQSNCTKNGLIGNFDHNLFETLKNNNINNNGGNDLFLTAQEGKYPKDDNRSLINNLQLSNNYDIFSTGIDNTAMDFESIIPYSDLQSHESLYPISGFDNRVNFGSFNDHNNLLFNDDTRMSNDTMTCEVDNLLCNL